MTLRQLLYVLEEEGKFTLIVLNEFGMVMMTALRNTLVKVAQLDLEFTITLRLSLTTLSKVKYLS